MMYQNGSIRRVILGGGELLDKPLQQRVSKLRALSPFLAPVAVLIPKALNPNSGLKGQQKHVGGCQNYGPFLGPYYNTAPNILGYPKRDHNFDNYPCEELSASARGPCCGFGILLNGVSNRELMSSSCYKP